MRRSGTQNHQFVRRIPVDITERLEGVTLYLPVGQATIAVRIGPLSSTIRVSLRTSDPDEVKLRTNAINLYLDNTFKALRAGIPTHLNHEQAVALSKDVYEAWSVPPDTIRSMSIEQGPDGEWHRVDTEPEELAEGIRTAAERLQELVSGRGLEALETPLGPIINKVLMERGIGAVDAFSRRILLQEFHRSLAQGFGHQLRNAEGDYRPDANANRFPPLNLSPSSAKALKVSLKTLVDEWWIEAEKTNRALSTYEAYKRIFADFSRFVGHDDAARVTKANVIAYKDDRLSKGTSAKTVKDSDLSALRSVFDWAARNDKLVANPAKEVKVAAAKRVILRNPNFTKHEISASLAASLSDERVGSEPRERWAGRRWAPWICAYSGARIGEVLQLRKQDVLTIDGIAAIRLTPEAGTIKDKTARTIPIHRHLIEQGFLHFVQGAEEGHLFLWSGTDRGAARSAQNRLRAFVRQHLSDPGVQPLHGWRHTFKTIALEAGIEGRITDAICGHDPDTVGKSYGIVTLKTMADALAKFPIYGFNSERKNDDYRLH